MKNALIISIVLLAGTVWAENYGGGSGTAEDPYQIWAPEQMNTIGLHPEDWEYGKHFKLMDNIDVSIYTGTQYNIIGNNITFFSGTFDGNSHIISNLTIAMSMEDFIGLFGYLGSGSQIMNLGIENVDIVGQNFVGGLVGWNDGGTITSCYATGTVSGTGGRIGGLVGEIYSGTITSCYATGTVSGSGSDGRIGGLVGLIYSGTITSCYAAGTVSGSGSDGRIGGLVGQQHYGTIKSCYATCTVSGTGGRIGGLVGENNDTITACYATGTVNGSSFGVGGLVGSNTRTITACYATGTVSGTDYVGGLAGNNSTHGSITSCYAACTVSGTDYVGGLVGFNVGPMVTITSCFATGTVSGSGGRIGGLVGSGYGHLTSCFWDIQTSGLYDSAGGIGKTTEEMQNIATFLNAGWDFLGESDNGTDDVWRMCVDGVDYPRLRWQFSKRGDLYCPDGVGLEDLIYLANRWLWYDCKVLSNCDWADINRDGTVNLMDFSVLAEKWLAIAP